MIETDWHRALDEMVRNGEAVYNECETCGANDSRCGTTISPPGGPTECLNCYHTRQSGQVVIHTELYRTNEQIQHTCAILDER